MYTLTQTLFNKDLLTEGEILSIKSRLTGYKKLTEANRKEAKEAIMKDEYNLTPEQQGKGYNWIMNKYKTPRGIERKNNPFGYREQDIIDNYSHFTFVGFYDNTNMYMADMGYKNLFPIWKMYSKDGNSFEYYVQGGECMIIG